MEAGEGPFETVDTMLLWLVYFGVPASFIVVRHFLMKCAYVSFRVVEGRVRLRGLSLSVQWGGVFCTK